MSSDPWGSTDDDPFSDDGLPVGSLAASDTAKTPLAEPNRLFAAASVVVASTVLVVSLAGYRGYGLVGLGAVAYLLAVLADLTTRRSRHNAGDYRRPLPTVGLRVATFVAALWVGWLVASSLAGSG